MALKSGLNAQFAFKAETTWGTAVTVDKFIPLVSESVQKQVARLESSGILAGCRVISTNQWTNGDVTVSGDINIELPLQGAAGLFKWMLGSNTTTSTGGTAPFTHTCTPGDLADDHITAQFGRPDTAGTVDAFTYTGLKCASWELAAKAGELVTLGVSVVGKDEATNTNLVSASYTNGVDASFTYINGTITVGGTTTSVREFSIKGDNGLNVDRRFLGAATISEPLEAALREYGGELMCDWGGFTNYNRFVGGSTAAVVATFSAGASASVTVTMNVRFDGETPNVSGTDVLEHKLPFKCTAGTDAGAITVAVVNSDSTA